MELEKFEEVYQVLEAQKEKDETAAELYADVKEFAYKYATMRYRFSEMSREEKAENDSYRTSQHNRFMDSVRIYFRYLQNNGVNGRRSAHQQKGRECAGHQQAGSGSKDFR